MAKCPKCKNEIADNLEVCPCCGKNISKGPSWGKVLLGIVALFLIFYIGPGIIAEIDKKDDTKENVSSIFERELRKSDYELIDNSTDGSVYAITIVPKSNIKECSITVIIYNASDEIIYQNTITKENLKKDKSYRFEFNHGFSIGLSARKVAYLVEGKIQS